MTEEACLKNWRGRNRLTESNMKQIEIPQEVESAASADNVAIRVQNLSKCYQIYDNPRDRLKQFVLPRVRHIAGKAHKQYFREFWALKDVSFEVKKGETVGIIGRNGSGKSTLLQMICGTLYPTSGDIQVNGRVAALLELGAGFNPEFNGRENIFTNGALLGLSRSEIEDRYDDIVAFADIGFFLDQPVKMYSSGMYVRLAFAIAANVEPSVLIIDEALAVGDLAFQAKCMGRLRDLMDSGTTILFVSHDLGSVRNICQKVLWLKEGRAMDFGSPRDVVEAYVREMHLDINKTTGADTAPDPVQKPEKLSDVRAPEETGIFLSNSSTRYGDGRATFLEVVIVDSRGNHAELLELHETFTIRMKVKANADIDRPVVGFSFRDLKGNQVVGAMNSNFPNIHMPPFLAGEVYAIEILGKNALAQGPYTLAVGLENIVQQNMVHQFLDVVENAQVFRSTFGSQTENIFPAMVWQDVDFDVQRIG